MRYTDWTWVSVGLQLLAVEIWALLHGDPVLTDSMRGGSNRWMLWPALFGTMCGHFFGTRVIYGWWSPLLIVPIAFLVIYRDLFVRVAVPSTTHMEIFLLFLGLGACLWGSRN